MSDQRIQLLRGAIDKPRSIIVSSAGANNTIAVACIAFASDIYVGIALNHDLANIVVDSMVSSSATGSRDMPLGSQVIAMSSNVRIIAVVFAGDLDIGIALN